MSSDEEDEFFDAPNAFVSSSLSKWSDSNEDLSLTALEIVNKNVERRNRVESLRRNGNTHSTLQHQDTLKDQITQKEEYSYQSQINPNLYQNCEVDAYHNNTQPIIQAMLYQQSLIQHLKADPNICSCMKNLLNTLSSQLLQENNITNHPLNNLPPLGYHLALNETSTNTQSCPECYKPIHSLLGLNQMLNNIKSWSLDTARTSDSDLIKRSQKLSQNPQSRTLPSDMTISPKSPSSSLRMDNNYPLLLSSDVLQGQCQNCQKSSEYFPSHLSTIKCNNQYLIPTDQNFGLPSDDIKYPGKSKQQIFDQCFSMHRHDSAYHNNELQGQCHSATMPALTTSSNAGCTATITAPCIPVTAASSIVAPSAILSPTLSSEPTNVTNKDPSSTLLFAPISSTNTEPKLASSFSINKPANTIDVQLPPEMNPIEIQFRERTKSMEQMLKETRNTSLQKSEDSDRIRDPNDFSQRAFQSFGGTVKRFQKNMKSAIAAVGRAKLFNPDEEASSEDEEFVGNRGIRLRSSRRMKGQRDFLQIKLVQEMKDEHTGAIWAMRFSPCGRLLATAGYDRSIRIWVLRQYYWYFKQYQKTAGPVSTASNSNSDKVDCEFGSKLHHHHLHNSDVQSQPGTIIPEDEICSGRIDSVSLASTSVSTGKTDGCGSTCSSGDDDIEQGRRTPFRSKPLIIYRGHEGVVTDLVWSKNLFLLATSMDRQVRLWHISRRECLCVFNHNDTVPTVVFHPKDDRYFLSGSLDGKLRLWNIPDKKIRCWVEALLPNSLPTSSVFFQGRQSSSNLVMPPKTVITCAAFVCEATKIAVGTYDGRVLFYTAELEYITSMAIKSSHGKNRHCRVTAIEVDPTDSCKILVTSNDSRVRLIDARDYHIMCKYRGFSNCSSQIRASFSPTGKYVISGSENSFFYIWKKDVEIHRMTRFSTTRKDRNNYWEAIKAHETVVSVSAFSPAPHLVLDKRYRRRHSVSLMPRNALLDSDNFLLLQQQHQFPQFLSGNQQMSSAAASSSSSSQYHSSANVGLASSNYLGEVIVSADINGCIRVFKNRIHSHPVSINK